MTNREELISVLGEEFVDEIEEGNGSASVLRVAFALEIWYHLHRRLDAAEWLERINPILNSTPKSYLLENKFEELDSAINAELST